MEDLPDIRVEASSPAPRVTFNIQDSVRFKTSVYCTWKPEAIFNNILSSYLLK